MVLDTGGSRYQEFKILGLRDTGGSKYREFKIPGVQDTGGFDILGV